mgnify:CR=1 FL=1|jgi:hypothetical protein|tara:strand:- start:1471 stop:1719 length:249 start_codon:yes stop_codon:yes gene_type:complete
MCGSPSTPTPPPAAPPPAPTPPPAAPTAAAPSATALPDTAAYSQAYSNKKKGKSIRNQLRIELGNTGSGASSTVGSGVNTNN